MKVSVIMTLLNEGQAIKRLLDSLVAQKRRPDEVIIVDGGSKDDTLAIIARYQSDLPLQVIVSPGANISQGRNIAIQAAAGPIIASTDAGVHLAVDWLAELVAPFEAYEDHENYEDYHKKRDSSADASPQVVAGFFLPDTQTPFEVAMGATVLPRLADINPQTFLPSSRSVAYHKRAWQEVGGYPEWIDFCEDLIFDLNLRTYTGPFVFAPKAVAYFRPRSDLPTFFKQYYQYSRGDGKADLWRKRHAIRYLTYWLAGPLLILLGLVVNPWWWLVGGLIGGLGLFYRPYKRLLFSWQALTLRQKLMALFWVPLIRITGDVAKMIGYPVGWRWRLKRLQENPQLRWRLPAKS